MITGSRKLRIALVLCALFLTCMGVVMVYSSSAIYADQHYGDSMFFLKKHLIALIIGMFLCFIFMRIDYRFFEKIDRPVLAFMMIGLVLVLIPSIGYEAGGARRWFRFAGFQIQPAEFAKVFLVMYVAGSFQRDPDLLRPPGRKSAAVLLPVGVALGLIFLEKDLGTPTVIGATVFTLLFVRGLSWRVILIGTGLLAAMFCLAVLAEPYRRRRLLSFLNPTEDIQDTGYQLWQSFLALGSGGLWGVGLGQSQEKLFYLPGAHTDFIFSIIGEELGFAGAVLVLLVFVVLIICGFMIVVRARDSFGQILALGIVLTLAFETLINIGASTGALPTKGMALPFVSYGGSSLLVKFMSLGLLLNISRKSEDL